MNQQSTVDPRQLIFAKESVSYFLLFDFYKISQKCHQNVPISDNFHRQKSSKSYFFDIFAGMCESLKETFTKFLATRLQNFFIRLLTADNLKNYCLVLVETR